MPKYDQPPPNYSSDKHATHGFSHNPSCSQIFIILWMIGQVAVFYVCIHFLLQSWVAFGLYTLSLVLMVVSFILTSCSNPTDRLIYEYKWSVHKKEKFNQDDDQLYFCDSCDSICKEESKHCRVCNRCVSGFDHHCQWINNCIGEQNYKLFIFMIFSTFFNIVVFIVSAILAILEEIDDKRHTEKIVPTIIWTIILILLGIALFILICFHLHFIRKGITTFQYIMSGRTMLQSRKTSEKEKKQPEQPSMEQSLNENYDQIAIRKWKEKERKKGKSQVIDKNREEEEGGNLRKSFNRMIGSVDVNKPEKLKYRHSSIL